MGREGGRYLKLQYIQVKSWGVYLVEYFSSYCGVHVHFAIYIKVLRVQLANNWKIPICEGAFSRMGIRGSPHIKDPLTIVESSSHLMP